MQPLFPLLWALAFSGLVFLRPAVGEMSGKQILATVNDRIETHRKRDVKLLFTLPDGGRLPQGSRVEVELTQHAFLFGSNFFAYGEHRGEAEATYRRRFSDVMNFATLPFYWNSYQPSPGTSDEARVRAAAEWCKAKGIATKGHPLVWNMEPAWLGKLPRKQRLELFWNRPTELVRDYAQLIDTWDVVNETTEGIKYAKIRSATALLDAYQSLGTVEVVNRMFARARKANSTATLILNDFVTDEPYEAQIQAALDRGAPIDVIGIQAHMHQGYWGVKELWTVCERFAKFGKPIHITEVTILSGTPLRRIKPDWTTHRKNWKSTESGEQRQAREVFELYHVLFSHPAVEAITWWDMSDRDAWLGAPGGLLRKDLEPKPAYYVVRDLVKKGWTTKLSKKLVRSKLEMRGFFGKYEARVTTPTGQMIGAFEIPRNGAETIPVRLTLNEGQ